jgi:hypothetical protein
LNADGYNVVVYPAGRGWSFRVSNRLTEKILASHRVAGDKAVRRFLEFFAATIRNKNTRMAYYRTAARFFAW